MGFGDVSKELGALWKGLTAKEKAPYEVRSGQVAQTLHAKLV